MDLKVLLKDFFAECPDMELLYDIACEENKIQPSDARAAIWMGGFLPGVVALLEAPDMLKDIGRTKSILTSVFSLFEKMSTMEEDSREFLKHMTMDIFYDRPELLAAAKPYMGIELQKVFQEYCLFRKEAGLWELSQLYSDEELETMTE